MNHHNDPLFIPADFAMLRTPLFSIDEYFEIFEKNREHISWLSFHDDQTSLLGEAIAIASPNLRKAIDNKQDGQQIQSSLIKYFSRMSTRSTPFGLFSFVSLARWGESTKVRFQDKEAFKKRIRPDMEWLSNVIRNISTNPDFLPFLTFYRNPLSYTQGDRVYLDYLCKKNNEDKTATASIRHTSITRGIFEITEKPKYFDEIYNHLIGNQLNGEKSRLQNLIYDLVKQQFLFCNLSASLLTESPFHDFLQKLSSTPSSLRQSFHDIATQMDEYNKTQPGSGEYLLDKIKKTMEGIESTPHLIQVDTANLEEITLSRPIAQELAQMAEVLWKISQKNSASYPLKTYHERFLEKYGVARIVPLLELLNEEKGLGVPAEFLGITPPLPHPESKWEQWFKYEVLKSLKNGTKEIEITEQVVTDLLEDLDKKKAPLSFDLFFEVIANSQDEVDRGEYLLLLFSNSNQGGATLGRFLDLFSQKSNEMITTFLEEEESLEKECLFVQSSYSVSNPRSDNVAIQPRLRRFALDLQHGKQEINDKNFSLEDVYVGTTFDRLYLTTKNQSQELIFVTANMLNHTIAPHPLRFIQTVSASRYLPFSIFNPRNVNHFSHVPRVRFQKAILAPAFWKVDFIQLNGSENESLESLKEKFLHWSKLWEVPRYCFLGEGDNKILFDLEHPLHIHEIVIQLKNRKEILLVEKVGQEEGQWVKSNRGTHVSEFVLPFRKNSSYQQSNQIPHIQYLPIPTEERFKLPGSEWLYLKCFLNISSENRFILDRFSPFANWLCEQQLITDWFFVRYGDNKDSHLRLRFKSGTEYGREQLLPIIHNWIYGLIQQGLIRDINFSTYEREIERYGGSSLIEFAEELFSADSATAISIIDALVNKRISLPDEVTTALSIIDMLKHLQMDLKAQLQFFSEFVTDKKELAGYRKYKNVLIPYAEAIFNSSLENRSKEGFLFFSAFQKRKKGLEQYAEKLQQESERGARVSSPREIYHSLIHMHCNRVMGRDHIKEKKARLYASHTLSLIQEKLNHSALNKNNLAPIYEK